MAGSPAPPTRGRSRVASSAAIDARAVGSSVSRRSRNARTVAMSAEDTALTSQAAAGPGSIGVYIVGAEPLARSP